MAKKTTPPDKAASYNRFKEYKGRRYTGMAIGRTHHWHYDQGEWKERKITPDKWELAFATTKRRAGHAPEGSGAPVGTGYHWFILAHQYVEKLNANDYTTRMTGLKFKLAHKRAKDGKWNASDEKQREELIQVLKDLIADLEAEPEQTAPVPFAFDHGGKSYEGTGIPILTSCEAGVCRRFDIAMNGAHIGILRHAPEGKWKMSEIKSQSLINALGAQIEASYEGAD